MRASSLVLIAALLAACGPSDPPPGAKPYFNLRGALAGDGQFFDFPFPSDLRLRSDGTPNLDHFPRPDRDGLLDTLIAAAERRRGFTTMPIAYFRFSEPLRPRRLGNLIPAAADSEVLLIDIDGDSPRYG
ncbi:MAG: hypothetical protein KJO07_03620, partial [Deltaproteobacteria bacterium]|nr:hypothetical protein [Deltaproteobacteria bacterium]